MSIKKYGLEVRIDNIALNFFQVQGIKIVTDLHPGNNNHIIILEETGLGISLATRKTQALPHDRD